MSRANKLHHLWIILNQFLMKQTVLSAHKLQLPLQPLHLRSAGLQILVFGHKLLVQYIPASTYLNVSMARSVSTELFI